MSVKHRRLGLGQVLTLGLILAAAGCGGPPDAEELAEGCGRGFYDSGLRPGTVEPGVDVSSATDAARRFAEAAGSVTPETADALLKVINGLVTEERQRTAEDLRQDAEKAEEDRTRVRETEVIRASEQEAVVRLIAEVSQRARPGPGGRYYSASRWTVDLVKQPDGWKVEGHSAQTVGPC